MKINFLAFASQNLSKHISIPLLLHKISHSSNVSSTNMKKSKQSVNQCSVSDYDASSYFLNEFLQVRFRIKIFFLLLRDISFKIFII